MSKTNMATLLTNPLVTQILEYANQPVSGDIAR